MTADTEQPWIRARVAPSRVSLAAIVRIGPPTPLLAQRLADDARGFGSDTIVELDVPGMRSGPVPPSVLHLQRRLEILAGRTVRVVIVSSRAGAPSPRGSRRTAAAARALP